MSAALVGSRVPRDRTILIAGMGTSSAVLTETVWALAHQDESTMSLKDLLAAQKVLMNQAFKGD